MIGDIELVAERLAEAESEFDIEGDRVTGGDFDGAREKLDERDMYEVAVDERDRPADFECDGDAVRLIDVDPVLREEGERYAVRDKRGLFDIDGDTEIVVFVVSVGDGRDVGDSLPSFDVVACAVAVAATAAP